MMQRRVRSKTTGRVGVELTPYGWPRYEIRSVLWDGDDKPSVVGITVLEDEPSDAYATEPTQDSS